MSVYRGRGTQIGDYRIECELSRTRGVTLFRAMHASLGRTVVLKVTGETQLFRGANTQLLHEARLLDRMQHPGIARVYDCGLLDDGRAWFAAEHLPGPTLADVIASGARIDLSSVVLELAAILEHAHHTGIAHRNLRAENVTCVVLPDGHVRLVIDGWSAARDLAGMPSDAGADVHALGLIAFQLLSGVMAFSAGSLAMVSNVSVAARFPRAPRAVAALVDRMIGRDLRSRPTMTQVRAAIVQMSAPAPSALQAAPPPELESEQTRIVAQFRL